MRAQASVRPSLRDTVSGADEDYDSDGIAGADAAVGAAALADRRVSNHPQSPARAIRELLVKVQSGELLAAGQTLFED